MPILLVDSLDQTGFIVEAEGAVRPDDGLDHFGKALGAVLYCAVGGARQVRRGDFGIDLGGFVGAHLQIAAIGQFQLNLPAIRSLDDIALADRVAGLQTADVAVKVASDCFTGDFSDAGDDFSHDSSPAQLAMPGVYGLTGTESIEPRYSPGAFA